MGFFDGAILSVVSGIVGPIAGIFNKKLDTDLEKYKVNGEVNIEAMKEDTNVIQARAVLAAVMKDDPVNRWGRRLFIYPVGTWFSLIIYDSAFRNILPDGWTWKVLALPHNLDYIPYAIVAYLFVSAWKK